VRVLCCAVADGGLEAACAFLYLIEEGSVELEFNGAIQVPKRKRKKQFQHFLFFLCVCVKTAMIICQDRLGTNETERNIIQYIIIQ
jgi:hypothetical protein